MGGPTQITPPPSNHSSGSLEIACSGSWLELPNSSLSPLCAAISEGDMSLAELSA